MKCNEENLLRNIAAQFRDELSEIYLTQQQLAPPERRLSEPLTDERLSLADRSRLRMTRLAQNMETCAALMSGKEFERENDDIVRLISTICEESADLAEYMGLRLTFFCAEGAHTCAIHTEYIRQLAYHLLSNAMRATPRGGRVRMSLRFQRSARRVLLSVEDSGRGIAPDRLPTLFDGVHDALDNPDKPCGPGLGLLICKGIAEGHGGFMTVESELGKGSAFTLNIPDEAKKTVQFRRPDFYVPYGGIHPSLVCLSDALPKKAFRIENQL